MLEPMPESRGDVLAVRALGVLTEVDYEEVLAPHVEARLEAGGRIRVLFLMDETFRGWDLRAAWCNTRLDLRQRRGFHKVAVCRGPDLGGVVHHPAPGPAPPAEPSRQRS
jgi:hypothetical protein